MCWVLVGPPGTVRQSLCLRVEGGPAVQGRQEVVRLGGRSRFRAQDLFAAGSGPSSWRSEVDVENIWARPARKGRISACEVGKRPFQTAQMPEQVGQWEEAFLGGAERGLFLCRPLPLPEKDMPSFVLPGPIAPSTLTSPPSGTSYPFLESLDSSPSPKLWMPLPGILQSRPHSHLLPNRHPRKWKT